MACYGMTVILQEASGLDSENAAYRKRNIERMDEAITGCQYLNRWPSMSSVQPVCVRVISETSRVKSQCEMEV